MATSWRTRRIRRGMMELVVKTTMMRRRLKRNGESGRMRVTGRQVLDLIAGGRSNIC